MTTQHGFAIPDLDWDNYMRYRPAYPEAVYERIHAYHAKHSSSCESAYEIGSGNGLVSAKLLEQYQHVTVSDPNPQYMDAARKFLGSVDPSRISFAQHRGEDVYSAGSNSVDIVATGQAIHWTEPQETLQQMHRVLRPGGTVAIMAYAVRPLVDTPRLQTAMDALIDAWGKRIAEYIRSQGEAMLVKYDAAQAIAQGHYDPIGFDPEQWRDVTRVKWLATEDMAPKARMLKESHVREDVETIELVPGRTVCQVQGNSDWITEYMYNIVKVPGLREETTHLKTEIDQAMGGREKTVTLSWPFVLLLATKR